MYNPHTPPTLDSTSLVLYISQELHSISDEINRSIDRLAADEAALAASTASIATNTAAIAAEQAVWTNYTPTISAASGTFTSASVGGRYKVVGKTVYVAIVISIATNGTAAGYVIASLPATGISTQILVGRENAVVGNILQAIVIGGNVAIINATNGYPGGNGYSLVIDGVYESV
jgi:hypothetical protein